MSDTNQPAGNASAQGAQPSLPGVQPPAVNNISVNMPKEILDELSASRAKLAAYEAEKKQLASQADETKVLVAQLNEKVALTEKQRAELETARKADAIRTAVKLAAMEHDAIDPDVVIKLVADEYVVDDKGAVVSKSNAAVTAKDGIKAFLEKQPYLQKPRVAPGSGARPFTATTQASAPPQTFDRRTRDGATGELHHNLMQRLQPKSTA